jgi:hypothetical protein
VVAKDDECEQQAEGEGRNDEEVDGDDVSGHVWSGTCAKRGTAGCAACSGSNFWRHGDGSLRTGGGSFRPRRPEPATDRRPADASTAGPEGEDDHPGTGKPGTGPD